jgi:hypothetical protein
MDLTTIANTLAETQDFGRALTMCTALHYDDLDYAVKSGQVGLKMKKVVDMVCGDRTCMNKAEKRRSAKFKAKYKVMKHDQRGVAEYRVLHCKVESQGR